MKRLHLLVAVAALAIATESLAAQRGTGSTASTGGTGGRARGDGARGEFSAPALPNSRVVANGMNPAAYLVDKKRKLKLDDATVTALTALATTMEERYAPHLARYDSLRAQANMSRNRMSSGLEPSAEERQIVRERNIVLARTMAEVRAQREADIAEALAAVPEDKQTAARELLAEQAQDMDRTFRRSGAEGAAAAGPGGRTRQ